MDHYLDLLRPNLLADIAIVAVLLLYPLWRIFSRAGIKPTASLLVIVPYAGPLMVMLLLAFLDWPTVKKGQTGEPAQ